MGNWIITIKGHGIHHNGLEDDADAIGRVTVERLLSVDGTTVDEATITTTGADYNTEGANVTDLTKPR